MPTTVKSGDLPDDQKRYLKGNTLVLNGKPLRPGQKLPPKPRDAASVG